MTPLCTVSIVLTPVAERVKSFAGINKMRSVITAVVVGSEIITEEEIEDDC